jgi:hypothetical protein
MFGTITKSVVIGVAALAAAGTAATAALYYQRRDFSIFESRRAKARRQRRVSNKPLVEKVKYAWGKGLAKPAKPSVLRERVRASMDRAKERGKQAVKEMQQRDRRNKQARARRAKLKRAA